MLYGKPPKGPDLAGRVQPRRALIPTGLGGFLQMVTKAERDRKNANAQFANLMDHLLTHLRVGQGRDDRTGVALVGHARDLHGPEGVCSCCPRRPTP
jgi:hypothetical protein